MKVTAFVLTALVILAGIAAGTTAAVIGFSYSYQLAETVMNAEVVREHPASVVALGVLFFALGTGVTIGLSTLGFNGFRAVYKRISGPLIRWQERRTEKKIQREQARRERLSSRKYKQYQDATGYAHPPYCRYPHMPCECRH